MAARRSRKLLAEALLNDGVMAYALYEYELEERLDELKRSLEEDENDFIFSITENSGDVAMVLLEASARVYINESARTRLRMLWKRAYVGNVKRLIPPLAAQLTAGVLPINGVTTVADKKALRTFRDRYVRSRKS